MKTNKLKMLEVLALSIGVIGIIVCAVLTMEEVAGLFGLSVYEKINEIYHLPLSFDTIVIIGIILGSMEWILFYLIDKNRKK